MQRLFSVEDVFEIRGRGLVLVPTTKSGLESIIKPGQEIQLRTPEGFLLDSRISSIEFLHGIGTDGKKFCRIAVMVPADVPKDRIRKETEVSSVSAQ